MNSKSNGATRPLFEIQPGKGIGPVSLGMSIEQVKEALSSFADSMKDFSIEDSSWMDDDDFEGMDEAEIEEMKSLSSAHFFESCLQVEFTHGVATHAEAYSDDEFFDCRLWNVDPFNMEADEVLKKVANRAGLSNEEFGSMYPTFSELGLVLANAAEDYDYKGKFAREVFQCIGVFKPGTREDDF